MAINCLELKKHRPIIIIGMHRSGTSLFTRLLAGCGLFVGRKPSVNAESIFFQTLNRQILSNCHSRWDNVKPAIVAMEDDDFVNSQSEWLIRRILDDGDIQSYFTYIQNISMYFGQFPKCWGFKDPRNSITLPIWLKVFPNAKVIHVIRNGVDSAISLYRRELARSVGESDFSVDAQNFEKCFFLWENYVSSCLKHKDLLDPVDYFELKYEDLLSDPQTYLKRAVEFTGMKGKDQLVKRTVVQINKHRLGNREYRDKFQNLIQELPKSELMQKLGYA